MTLQPKIVRTLLFSVMVVFVLLEHRNINRFTFNALKNTVVGDLVMT